MLARLLALTAQETSPSFASAPAMDLTEREREILWRVARGERSKEIATHLGISIRTSLPILARGKRRAVHLDAARQTYAYVRTLAAGQSMDAGDALVLFNLSEATQTLALPAALLPTDASSVLTTNSIPVISRTRHQVEFTLVPLCGAVFSLLSAITTFQMFTTVYLITQGGPIVSALKPGATEFVMVYMYNRILGTGIANPQYGFIAAFAIALFLILAVLTFLAAGFASGQGRAKEAMA